MRKHFFFTYNKAKAFGITVTFPRGLNIPDMNGDIYSQEAQQQIASQLEQFIGEPNNDQTRNSIRHTLNQSCLNIDIDDITLS